jgi:DUF1680 family protein
MNKDGFADETTGEFTYRMKMAEERLTGSKYNPVFTPEFILADVNINKENPRRFDNYSGDISGRYIEVLSASSNHEVYVNVHNIVEQVMKYQHPDGRFGDPALVYKEELIDKTHMPLLWGNGRLLTGLVHYYLRFGNDRALQTARRLGDFFLNSYKEVTPEISKRLAGRGAEGIICFTQYVEPLVLLSVATGDPKYAQVAANVYPTLPERTNLHTHGYLTTMRGVLQLYEYDKNPQHLDYVVKAYSDLVASNDYTLFGSVTVYFGGVWGGRDEGCSTADFIQLSLHLYKITGNVDYLERAEFAIHNALYYNQYFTGDFGSHTVNRYASSSEGLNAAWWCCTMAGLRVMQIVRNDYFAEVNDNMVKLNLFLDTDYAGEHIAFSVTKGRMQDDWHTYNIRIEKVDNSNQQFSVRYPSWAETIETFLNGKKVENRLMNDYIIIDNKLAEGDLLQLRIKYRMKIIKADNTSVPLKDVTQRIYGALCYGPYVMGVDTKADFVFSSEPNNNTVFTGTITNGAGNQALTDMTSGSFACNAYLLANYKHDGFPSYYQTVFRPVSELTFLRHPFMQISTSFASEAMEQFKLIDKNTLVPWKEI